MKKLLIVFAAIMLVLGFMTIGQARKDTRLVECKGNPNPCFGPVTQEVELPAEK